MQSVWAQTYPHLEYIVVDGGSTDGTVELLRAHEKRIHRWVSEPDGGLYDAMNKGVAMATGDIIGFVNSDDALSPTACEIVAQAFEDRPDLAFVCGSVDVVALDGTLVGRTTPVPTARLPAQMYREMPFPHLGVFAAKHLFEQHGGFETRYRFTADWELMLRWLEAGVPHRPLEDVLGRFRLGGCSGSFAALAETRRLLSDRGLGRLHVERVFWSSLVKARLVEHLPRPVVSALQRLRPHSRHRLK